MADNANRRHCKMASSGFEKVKAAAELHAPLAGHVFTYGTAGFRTVYADAHCFDFHLLFFVGFDLSSSFLWVSH